MDDIALTIDNEEVESIKELTAEIIEELDYFRSCCKRYKVPVNDLQEINEALADENLISSIRQNQLEKHPLNGQVEFNTLKLSEKIVADIQEIEDSQNRIKSSSRKYIIEHAGNLAVDVKFIKESCSVFGSEKAKIALEKISKASDLINDVRGKTHYTDQLHNFTNLFTANSDGQIIPNMKVIKDL